ncbi:MULTISPECIES: HlyD family efflux transporter periplasmic adaptor subunit [unclassified Micromonospora]|uniref:efflux RND transporter periplasmic adaptor subunit n=1 Tax=unclassified Micromonospora TaxID=2617518 RepID=UPI001C24699D|nr:MULTISPECIES: HlyD family efflux transporter periplasmic adaptor subunit [unclassified Micromonospora]MBU8861636.1 HlyD family efflux transporter periplasmic adaptor subunit [Micromonospora sp. WMMB482]MDM4781205.1 HlyD family efflux transporter periplasmic adaptor subunit [Micromonospora sp. b486]
MGIHLHVWRAIRRRPVPAVATTAALVAVTAAAGVAALSGGADRNAAPAATVRVDRGEVTSAVAATGSVRPSAGRGLAFTAAGTVTEVRVRPGADVTAGQVLAVLDDGEARAEVTRTEQALADARAALDDLEAEEEPDTPACATSPVAAAQGGAGGAAAAATEGEAVRTTPSGDTGSPTPGSGSEQPSHSPAPSAAPAPTGSSGSPAEPSPGETRTGPVATATAPASADPRGCPTQSGGSRPGGTAAGTDPLLRAHQQVTAAQLALAEAEDRLAGTTITAPVDGRVLSVAGPVGARVSAGARFVELAVVDGMQVTATFPEADAGRIAVGQTATVTPAGRSGTDLAAEVVQLDPVGASDGQVVRFGVRLALDDAPDDLLIGQSAAVRIRIATVTDVLRVPAGAVQVQPDGSGTVLLAGAAEPRAVVIGVRGDQFVEIRSGLAEGDLVVATG